MTNEDTQVIDENEALIAEMLRDAKEAEVPSELKDNPVIHKGDEDLPSPITVAQMKNAGYVWIYDTRTGERMPCLRYMVPQKMRQRRQDGSFRFTTNKPSITPRRGTIKCMLHEDSPDREHYNELGFRECKKSNITNQYQLTQHMRRRHPQEWAAIEKEREDREKKEDRALQRMLLGVQANKFNLEAEDTIGTQDAPLYVSDKPKKRTRKKK